MIQTGLKYTQYKVDDGSFIFKLEPAGVETLIAFGTETKGIRGRYAVRQLVSREMEREKIRRRRKGPPERPRKFLTVGAEEGGVEEPRGMKRGRKQVDEEKEPVAEKVRKDFFGRVIVEQQAADEGKRRRTDWNHALKTQPDVWVRYHEGYSNAVRKPVAFAELAI